MEQTAVADGKSVGPDFVISRFGKRIAIVSKNDRKPIILTNEILKKMIGVPMKLRFDGVSRAQIGGVLAELKSNDMIACTNRVVRRNGDGGVANVYIDATIKER